MVRGWLLVLQRFFMHRDLGSVLYEKPLKKGYVKTLKQFDTLHCFVGFWFDHGGYCGLAMLAGNLIVVLDFYIFATHIYWGSLNSRTI